jgi:CubicO group peptidase (beta-lactamase class C family)
MNSSIKLPNLLAMILLTAAAGYSDEKRAMVFTGESWEKASAASQGLDKEKFVEAMDYLAANAGGVGADETAVIRNGYLVWEGAAAHNVHEIYSATKTFTSTVLGLLVTDGVLSIDDPAVKYLPWLDDKYPLYSKIKLKDLASMSSGYDSVMGDGWKYYSIDRKKHREYVLKYTTPGKPLYEAGKSSRYYDPQVHMLGYILTKVSGKPLEEIIRRRIAGPIGMKHFSWSNLGERDGMFFNNPAGTPGINQKGQKQGGVYSNALDLARYGLLYLNKGNWNGRQLLDPNFVEQATSSQVPVEIKSNLAGRYGFYWWTNGMMANGRRPIPSAPAKTYMARGAGRNFIIVLPEWNMVIVRLSTAPGGNTSKGSMKEQVWEAFFSRLKKAVTSKAIAGPPTVKGYITSIPPESTEHREKRHKKIAERRAATVVIVHRGAWALAPENTLEAYSAAMDYGADGCEIDIRRTTDGVLVMLHDDGLDRMTNALGPINQYTYAELLRIKFRAGYRAKAGTRIPTLAAVLQLARQRAMLLHLDVKEPGLEDDIAMLLDAADVWDHVVAINESNAAALRKNPKVHLLAYKPWGWQEGRMDMSPEKVRDGLAKPGNMIMVDDPRLAAHELGRKTLHVPLPDNLRAPWSSEPAAGASQTHHNSLSPAAYLRSLEKRFDSKSLDELEKLITADFPKRKALESDTAYQQRQAHRILERAWAALKIGQLQERSQRAVKLLEKLVAHRSLHPEWAYQGLDGAMAARALGVLGATESVPFLIQTFLTVDPELKKMVKPPANYNFAWGDFRLKREIICTLGELPCEAGRKFLHEYLAMDKETAEKVAPPLFEEATRALLRQKVTTQELQELLQSTNSGVRGTAILVCLDSQRPGRISLLEKIVPWARKLPRAEK